MRWGAGPVTLVRASAMGTASCTGIHPSKGGTLPTDVATKRGPCEDTRSDQRFSPVIRGG
jgi:hypothetical protein